MLLPLIETARLRLRVYKESEMERVYELSSDKDVTRYFPADFKLVREEVLKSLPKRIERWQIQGFGQFGVFDKADETLLGYCGFQYLDDSGMVEIYYGFFREFWNRGFATEAARAVLRFGFEEIGLPKIVAVTHPENFDSQKVLRKIGLRGGGPARYYNLDVTYFELDAADYRADDSVYKVSFKRQLFQTASD
jgi:RimJ/RimL family protein N-acetyltransferase